MDGDMDPSEFRGFLQEIIDAGEYNDEIEKGIMRRVVNGGDTDKLSSKQRYILEQIIDRYPDVCSFCDSEIPWSERRIAADQKDRCSHCENLLTSNHT